MIVLEQRLAEASAVVPGEKMRIWKTNSYLSSLGSNIVKEFISQLDLDSLSLVKERQHAQCYPEARVDSETCFFQHLLL